MTNILTVCLVGFIISEIKCTMGINNRARSTIPPLNIPVEDIPMFLTITFDDALHGPAHEKTELIMNHKNRNGEQIPLVYFISNEFSDYSLIQERYLQGCEMAIHTVTHTTNVATDMIKWYHEIKTSRELLSTHADIPLSEIVGFRAPFLEKSDLSFQVLNSLQPPFLYDSTVISPLRDDDLFDWPYTFDVYESSYLYPVGQGPKQSYPGFWEIPMYELYANISNGQAKGIMDYIGDYTLFDIFKANFLHRMNTNKSPMGLYFHSSWLYTPLHADAMNDFIEWVLSLDNTWIVTNKDVINWINHPITNAQYSYINNNELLNGKSTSTFTSCIYPSGIFKTIQTKCPPIIPHDLRYDDTQLINSNIIITSSSDNILTSLKNLCVHDNALEYNPSRVYCAHAPTKNLVQYNYALYECQWWTKAETPGVAGNAWQFVKQCALYTESFVKGIISPYGTVSVFQDNVLDITVNIHTGFHIPRIFVTIDNDINNVYNLSIFEDFEFHSTATSATLIIRFAEIIYAQYTITFSFQDQPLLPTLPPIISPSIAPTLTPINSPSISPTISPSIVPTQPPSQNPTVSPSTPSNPPTIAPTINPTKLPSLSPSYDTISPTQNPTINPTNPTQNPTINPSTNPTPNPSVSPTTNPSKRPTGTPTVSPTLNDLCMYDKYTFYDSNTIYCANINGMDEYNEFEVVRFMDSLYQCQQRTHSLTPVSLGEDVWLFIKDCLENPYAYASTSIHMIEDGDEERSGEISMIISKSAMNVMIGGLFVMLGTIAVCIVLCWVICKKKQKNKYETRVTEIGSPKSTTASSTLSLTPVMSQSGTDGRFMMSNTMHMRSKSM